MVRTLRIAGRRLPFVALLAIGSGCTMVPRSQVAECQQVSQMLRSENARYKDQNLALQAQNRDYADRAVDDARRLAAQEETIEQLKESNLAYRKDRSQLEAAFIQLTANLGDFGAGTGAAMAWPRTDSVSAKSASKDGSAPIATASGATGR